MELMLMEQQLLRAPLRLYPECLQDVENNNLVAAALAEKARLWRPLGLYGPAPPQAAWPPWLRPPSPALGPPQPQAHSDLWLHKLPPAFPAPRYTPYPPPPRRSPPAGPLH